MVLTNLRNCIPFPVCCLNFEPHNLNHVSVFFLTLRLSCLPLYQPVLTYPSPHHLTCTGVGWSTYLILSFYISLDCHTNNFTLFQSFVFHQSFFSLLLPWVLSPTFHFCLSLTTLFTFLTCFSQFAFPACLRFCVCCLCLCICRNLNCLCQLKLV